MPYKPIDDWTIEHWTSIPLRINVEGPDEQHVDGPDPDGDFGFTCDDGQDGPIYVPESVLRAMLAMLDRAREKENG